MGLFTANVCPDEDAYCCGFFLRDVNRVSPLSLSLCVSLIHSLIHSFVRSFFLSFFPPSAFCLLSPFSLPFHSPSYPLNCYLPQLLTIEITIPSIFSPATAVGIGACRPRGGFFDYVHTYIHTYSTKHSIGDNSTFFFFFWHKYKVWTDRLMQKSVSNHALFKTTPLTCPRGHQEAREVDIRC